MKRLSEHYKFSRVEFSLKDVEDEKTRRAIRDFLSDLTVLYTNLAKMLNELGLLTTEYLDQEVKTTSSPEFIEVTLTGGTNKGVTFESQGAIWGTANGPAIWSADSSVSARFYDASIIFNGPVYFRNSSDNFLAVLLDGGNFGLGESNPSAKLDVAGTAKFSGKITSSQTFQGGTVTNSGGGDWFTVNFSTTFSSTPIVVATGDWSAAAGSSAYFVIVRNITTSSFQIRFIDHDGSNHAAVDDKANWFAFVP